MNTYEYASANPIRFIDPSGQITSFETVIIGEVGEVSHVGGLIAGAAALDWIASYEAGTLLNDAINHFIYDDKSSIGSAWYDLLHSSSNKPCS